MKKLVLFTLLAGILAACDNDDPDGRCEPSWRADSNLVNLVALIKAPPATRVTDDGINAPAWSANDSIGLFCTQSLPAANNLKYIYSGSNWTTPAPVYWKDSTSLHPFYAYYPYAAGNSVTSVPVPALNTQTGSINAAQNVLYSNNNAGGISKTGSGGTVTMVFKHALALIRLEVVIDSVSVVSPTTLNSVTLTGAAADKVVPTTLASGATLNITSGTITNGSAVSNTVTATPATPVTLTKTPQAINILVLPGAFTLTLGITCTLQDGTTGSVQAALTAGSATAFAADNKYTYTVKLSRNAITIGTLTINPWTAGGSGTVNPIF